MMSVAKFFLCVCLFITLPAQAKRLALVMGNDNYTSVTKLQKAGNDATAMARELRAAGFTVQLHKDLNYRGMVKAVEAFTNSITGGDEVVVFFAGHGVQIRTGSYLLPTDIEATSESEVEKTAYELNALTDRISEAKPAFSLIMVDACRDNPLKSKGRNVGGTRGLSAFEPPKGQMVVYSASRGQQALDRLSDKDSNLNGVFTREFIARMKKPGLKIEDLMRDVQDSVESLAKSVSHEQRPAIYNEARGNFYFFGLTTVQTASNTVLSVSAEQRDEKFWDDVKAAGNKEAYEAYLQRYPAGLYANLAKANISRLTENPKPSVPQASVAAANNAVSNLPGDAETQQLYRLATVQKDARAQNNLGVRYQNGSGGLAKDEVEAAKYYRLAADQGHAGGQANLGDFYRTGSGGLAKDDVEAAKYYRLSANQGNAQGQNSLGVFYSSGRGGLAKDDVEAVKYHRLAAVQGNAPAQANLGAFYATGRGGLLKDDVEAAKYYRLSADQGNSGGLVNLGFFYSTGRGGLVKDDVEAAKYYRLAANQGHPGGQTNLGVFYANGRGGLVKDEVEAIRLYKLAARQNNVFAQEQLKKLGHTW